MFDPLKSEILSEIKRVIYRDLEDTVYRLPINYDKIIDTLDVKFNAGSTIRYTLPPGLNKINDTNMMLSSLLPGKVKVNITIDDVRL